MNPSYVFVSLLSDLQPLYGVFIDHFPTESTGLNHFVPDESQTLESRTVGGRFIVPVEFD